MDRRRAATLRNVLAFFLGAILAVWVGGSLLMDAMVVPTMFRVLPRAHAVELGTEYFHSFNFLESLLGIVSIGLAFGLGRAGWRTVRSSRWAFGLLLGMTLIALVFLLVLTPAIDGKVGALTESGVDWNDPGDMPPDRSSLRTLHTIYGAFDLLKILGGLGVFWLLAKRGPR